MSLCWGTTAPRPSSEPAKEVARAEPAKVAPNKAGDTSERGLLGQVSNNGRSEEVANGATKGAEELLAVAAAVCAEGIVETADRIVLHRSAANLRKVLRDGEGWLSDEGRMDRLTDKTRQHYEARLINNRQVVQKGMDLLVKLGVTDGPGAIEAAVERAKKKE